MNDDIQRQRKPGRARVLVVGVDFTDVSEHLVQTAWSLARTADEAELHFVHVVRPPMSLLMPESVHVGTFVEDRMVEAARAELLQMCCPTDSDGDIEVYVHTPIGRVGVSLAEIAQRLGADLIVVEAHDHSRDSALHWVFHGSTAAWLARSAHCSVLTVRAKHSVPGGAPAGAS
jgi:nucleotide-binding universal stress UspA family protein